MEGLRRTDRFNVYGKGMISSSDFQILTLLYQPIMGQGAFVLYLTLQSLLDRQKLASSEFLHSDLEGLLNERIEQIEQYRFRLEALGLLKTTTLNDLFVYELKNVLSADQFVNDGVLGEYLIQSITKDRFKKIIEIFKIKTPPKSKYIEISKSFDEVFSSISTEDKTIENDLYSSKNNHHYQIASRFDWRFFLESIPREEDKACLSDVVRNKIVNLAYVYGLSELDMKDIFLRSIDDDLHLCNLGKLAVEARGYYKLQSDQNPLPQTQKESAQRELPKDPESYFKTVTPIELLQGMSGGLVSSSDLRTMERLIEDIGMDKGVVNVLVAFIANMKDGHLPGYEYFEKVAISWKKDKINSVETAMEYVKHLEGKYKSSSKKTNIKKPKEDIQLDWLDDYLDNIMKGS